MNSVELRPAYEWTCDECGVDQFEHGIVAELSKEERDELAEDHGIEHPMTGDWMIAPEEVICKWCGTTYKTQHWSQDADS